MKYIENKIPKSIELLFNAKTFLNKLSLLSLYYSYIHSYINYANVLWGSTYMTNLKTLPSQQKHAMCIICNKGNSYSSRTKLSMYINWISWMWHYLCERLIQTLLRIFFFQGFKNSLIFILLDSRNLTTYNQSTISKRVNTQFQLEDHISGIAFLAPKINKSLIYTNLKL